MMKPSSSPAEGGSLFSTNSAVSIASTPNNGNCNPKRLTYRSPSAQLLHVFVLLKDAELHSRSSMASYPDKSNSKLETDFIRTSIKYSRVHANGIVPLASLRLMTHRNLRWFHRSHIKSAMSTLGLKLVDIKKAIAMVFLALHEAKCIAKLCNSRNALQCSSEFVCDCRTDSTSSLNVASNTDADTISTNNEFVDVPLALGICSLPAANCVAITMEAFESITLSAISTTKHFNSLHSPILLKSSLDNSVPMILFLCGTSGTGKSTLAALLSDRLRIPTVLHTDSVRHVLRTSMSPEKCPSLFVSTYEAHRTIPSDELPWQRRVKIGYKKQSALVCTHMEPLLHSLLDSGCSVIVEGVHLLPSFVMQMMRARPRSILPFLIYISNENKHRQRLSHRTIIKSKQSSGLAKSSTAHQSPQSSLAGTNHKETGIDDELIINRYVDEFLAIRSIQRYLHRKSESFLIPSIDNTNVDRSVAAVHELVLRWISRCARGENVYEEPQINSGIASLGQCALMHHELQLSQASAWSSKSMQKIIRQKVEKRELFRRMFEMRLKNNANPDDVPFSCDSGSTNNGYSVSEHPVNHKNPIIDSISTSHIVSSLHNDCNNLSSCSSAELSALLNSHVHLESTIAPLTSLLTVAPEQVSVEPQNHCVRIMKTAHLDSDSDDESSGELSSQNGYDSDNDVVRENLTQSENRDENDLPYFEFQTRTKSTWSLCLNHSPRSQHRQSSFSTSENGHAINTEDDNNSESAWSGGDGSLVAPSASHFSRSADDMDIHVKLVEIENALDGSMEVSGGRSSLSTQRHYFESHPYSPKAKRVQSPTAYHLTHQKVYQSVDDDDADGDPDLDDVNDIQDSDDINGAFLAQWLKDAHIEEANQETRHIQLQDER